MAIKRAEITEEIAEQLRGMEWRQDNGRWIGAMPQMDRKMYVKVNKALELLGGKWDRREKGHVFSEDPRPAFQKAEEDGMVEFDNMDFYPTPPHVAKIMIEWLNPEINSFVLEPSAGEGHLADELVKWGYPQNRIICMELDEGRRRTLLKKKYLVKGEDFLLYRGSIMPVGYILMNPPFTKDQDIDHVSHAIDMLSPGGKLVSVMSSTSLTIETSKCRKFREKLKELTTYHYQELDKGSFKESGTMSNQIILFVKRKR